MKFNILDLLLPRETKFFDHMQRQIDFLIQSADVYRTILVNLESLSETELKAKLAEIKDLEVKGDDVEHQIIDDLHKTFITPFDREDIHTMATNIDRAQDILNNVAQKIDIYHIRKVPQNVCNFADIIVEISAASRVLMTDLKNKNNIDPIVQKLHELENRADYLFHISIAELFAGQYNPIDIIRFKELYERMEKVVDCIDYLGKFARGIMVKLG